MRFELTRLDGGTSVQDVLIGLDRGGVLVDAGSVLITHEVTYEVAEVTLYVYQLQATDHRGKVWHLSIPRPFVTEGQDADGQVMSVLTPVGRDALTLEDFRSVVNPAEPLSQDECDRLRLDHREAPTGLWFYSQLTEDQMLKLARDYRTKTVRA